MADSPARRGGDLPIPLADPVPPPVMITAPCGCTWMDTGHGGPPVQVAWCVPHDPGYEPPAAGP